MIDSVRAWHPAVPGLREVLHATFERHAYPAHTHDDWTVLLIDAGAVAYGLDRGRHHAEPTSVTILPPGIPHDGQTATPGRPFRKRVLYLDRDWLPAAAESAAATSPTVTGADALATVRAIHLALAEPGDEIAAESGILRLGALVAPRLLNERRPARDEPLARRLRDLLDDRIGESLTLRDAAAELGAHPGHLVRVFVQAYGIPPHRYLIGRRVDRARRLISRGWSPARAAAESGFYDQAHLSRHFRRVLGATPGTFAA